MTTPTTSASLAASAAAHGYLAQRGEFLEVVRPTPQVGLAVTDWVLPRRSAE